MHLCQDPPLDRVEVEEEFAEELVVLHQLLPRGRRRVSPGPSAGQGYVLRSVPCYPGPARRAVAQTLIIGRRHVAHRPGHAPARLFRGYVRIVRALQIRVGHPAASAEYVRNAFHDAALSPT